MGFYESFIDWTSMESSFYGSESGVPDAESPFDNLGTLFIEDPEGVDRVFDEVEAISTSDPFLALAQCSLLAGVINTAAGKAQRLTKRLSNAISRLQKILAGTKTTLGFTSFTITVGFPISVSIGVTW
jgi:hypothetical protein